MNYTRAMSCWRHKALPSCTNAACTFPTHSPKNGGRSPSFGPLPSPRKPDDLQVSRGHTGRMTSALGASQSRVSLALKHRNAPFLSPSHTKVWVQAYSTLVHMQPLPERCISHACKQVKIEKNQPCSCAIAGCRCCSSCRLCQATTKPGRVIFPISAPCSPFSALQACS